MKNSLLIAFIAVAFLIAMSNVLAQEFTAQGYVRDSSGKAVKYVSVSVSGDSCYIGPVGSGSGMTGSDGRYYFAFPVSGGCDNNAITPSKAGCTFTPVSSLKPFSQRSISQDFTANCAAQQACAGSCKTSACSSYASCAAAAGTCGSGYCCSGACTTPTPPPSAETVSMVELKAVLMQAVKDYFSSSSKLTVAEIKDLIVAYLSTAGSTANLSVTGKYSREKLIDIYNKAKGGGTGPSIPPALGVTPNLKNGAIILGWGGSGPGVVYIWNKGTGAISWTATANPDSQGRKWLSLSTDAQTGTTVSGTTNAEATEAGLPKRDKIKVTANKAGLVPGTYKTTITVSALGNNVEIPVYFYIIDLYSPTDPILVVYPPALIFSADEGSTSSKFSKFKIQAFNKGISWSASTDQPWLAISQNSGTLKSAEETILAVSAYPSGLKAGTYDGYIKFDAANARGTPYYLHVILKIHQAGWDLPQQILDINPLPTITPLESLVRTDSDMYGIWPDSITGAGIKYYSVDPTAFTSSYIGIHTDNAGPETDSSLFVIRKGWTDWLGASGNGSGLQHSGGTTLSWDSENERYYVKFECLSPTGCTYLINWGVD